MADMLVVRYVIPSSASQSHVAINSTYSIDYGLTNDRPLDAATGLSLEFTLYDQFGMALGSPEAHELADIPGGGTVDETEVSLGVVPATPCQCYVHVRLLENSTVVVHEDSMWLTVFDPDAAASQPDDASAPDQSGFAHTERVVVSSWEIDGGPQVKPGAPLSVIYHVINYTAETINDVSVEGALQSADGTAISHQLVINIGALGPNESRDEWFTGSEAAERAPDEPGHYRVHGVMRSTHETVFEGDAYFEVVADSVAPS